VAHGYSTPKDSIKVRKTINKISRKLVLAKQVRKTAVLISLVIQLFNPRKIAIFKLSVLEELNYHKILIICPFQSRKEI